MKNSRSRSVLFLSLSGIGNLVMQLPTIKVLKESHPDWHIAVWVAPRGTKELALAQPYIDEVLEMPITASMFQHIQNIFTLRNKHFDIGIVLTPGQLLKSAVYLFLAGIPRRIGHMYPFRGNIESSFLLTDAIPEELDTHDVEQNIKLLEILGVYAEKNQPYHIQIPEKNKEEALASLPLTKGEMEGVKFIGIHAGSAQGFEFKHWPIERYAEVARYVLQKDPTITFLLFGGPAEDDQKKKLKALIDSSNVIEVSASLMTTAALMQYCKCILSGDRPQR
jgi:ADP-heptose:LPS heptosyltransferase